jgi:hydroxyacylglutathione hydrolase
MTLRIHDLPAGPIQTNSFLVVDTDTNEAIVIDVPPDAALEIQHLIEQEGVIVREIVLTHGHWDHIVDTNALATVLSVPVAAHEGVRQCLELPTPESSPVPITAGKIDRILTEGDRVTVGAHTFDVWYLPGHDQGHIGLYSAADNVLIGGDVLFPNGHGRTDIPGSDQTVMNETLKRLLVMADETIVYTGHGNPTTIGEERPWITRIP